MLLDPRNHLILALDTTSLLPLSTLSSPIQVCVLLIYSCKVVVVLLVVHEVESLISNKKITDV